jgi:hypothetical protein
MIKVLFIATAGDKLYSKAGMTCGVVVQPVVMTEILTTVLLRMMWVL